MHPFSDRKRRVDPILERALISSGVSDAITIYEQDRDNAIEWFRERNFPEYDANSELGLRVLRTLALIASEKSVWREAWAGFHLVISQETSDQSAKDIANNCLELGKAHIGMHKYELSLVYLTSAKALSNQHPSPDFRLHVGAHLVVLAMLRNSSTEYDALFDEVMQNSLDAKQVAAITFEEGIKNARWADDQGRRYPDTLRLAGAQIRISLEINKRLRVPHAVGVTLCELGDVHKHMGQVLKARTLYMESLDIMSLNGSVEECQAVKQRIASLSE